jgi:glucose-1-phosphate cytidylyltransferase
MKVVILCGGKGTRIREETEFKPKPMIEVGGHPVVWHIMQRYAKYGYKDFILALGYKAEVAKEYFYHYRMRNSDFTIDLGNGDVITHGQSGGFACEDWRITLCDTGEETLKGARIKRVAKHIDTDRFMVTYGDGVSDINIDDLVSFHKTSGKMGTFTGVRMPSRFGTVKTDAAGNITSWQEKPILDEYINCGFFVFRSEFLDYLSEDEACDLEKEPMEKLAAQGDLSMYQHKGFWQCMDTLRDHQLLTELWESGKRPWVK